MSFFPGNDPLPGDAFACDAIELMVIPNARDIDGFQVRRVLPTARRRLVVTVSRATGCLSSSRATRS